MALLQPLATRVKNNHNNHVKKTPHWKHNSIIYRHNKYMVKIYKHYYHLRRERERKKKARSLPHHLGPNRQPQSRPNPSPAPAASWRSPGVPAPPPPGRLPSALGGAAAPLAAAAGRGSGRNLRGSNGETFRGKVGFQLQKHVDL